MTTSPSEPVPEVWGPFIKSSFSGGGGCVEVAMSSLGNVLVRDNKAQDGPLLKFNRTEWAAFLAGVRGNEFELPPQ